MKSIRDKMVAVYVKGYVMVKGFMSDEKGDIVQTSVILGILAILAIAVLTLLKAPITAVFNKIVTALRGM